MFKLTCLDLIVRQVFIVYGDKRIYKQTDLYMRVKTKNFIDFGEALEILRISDFWITGHLCLRKHL